MGSIVASELLNGVSGANATAIDTDTGARFNKSYAKEWLATQIMDSDGAMLDLYIAGDPGAYTDEMLLAEAQLTDCNDACSPAFFERIRDYSGFVIAVHPGPIVNTWSELIATLNDISNWSVPYVSDADIWAGLRGASGPSGTNTFVTEAEIAVA
jgi:hypothetical protein